MTATTLNDRIAQFKRWAQANLARLHELPACDAADEVGEALLLIDEQLGVEIEDEASDERELIITAFSDPGRFLLVQRIVAALSGARGWSPIALKPPRGFEFTLTVGRDEIDASELRFAPISDIPGGIKILVDPSIPLPPADASDELAWLIVETGIGEELTGRLQHIEFATRSANSSSKAIGDLAEFAQGLPPPSL